MIEKNPTIKNPRQIVTGIKWWTRKTGELYTVIFYSVPILPTYGKGTEGKQCVLSGHIKNIDVDDSIFLNFDTNFDGRPYVKSVTVLNKKS